VVAARFRGPRAPRRVNDHGAAITVCCLRDDAVRPPVRMKQFAQSTVIQQRINGWEQYDCARKHLVGVPGAVLLPSRDETHRR